MSETKLKDGDTFECKYPFVRDTYHVVDGDEDGINVSDAPTWKPGVRHENIPPEGDTETHADGLGLCRLTVVATFKPGKYPERVFFTRSWVTPDGKPFGKNKLRITTIPVFRNYTRGYRHWRDVDFLAGQRVNSWEIEDQMLAEANS